MAQFKKAEVREALLDSAYKLFAKRGYARTSVKQIAAGAKVSEANLYVYFKSKLDIFFGVYEPWWRERIHQLEGRLSAETDRRRKLELVLTTLWCHLPADDNGFSNNLMQALSTIDKPETYRPTLLRWIEGRLEAMLADVLPAQRWALLRRGGLVHILMMAQDGFAMWHHVNPTSGCGSATVAMFVSLLLGDPLAATEDSGDT
ncbi:MAG: TetR/AcrR family transcriptional regulator [Burkholderiaceae bacterium]